MGCGGVWSICFFQELPSSSTELGGPISPHPALHSHCRQFANETGCGSGGGSIALFQELYCFLGPRLYLSLLVGFFWNEFIFPATSSSSPKSFPVLWWLELLFGLIVALQNLELYFTVFLTELFVQAQDY
eukprot:RCo019030